MPFPRIFTAIVTVVFSVAIAISSVFFDTGLALALPTVPPPLVAAGGFFPFFSGIRPTTLGTQDGNLAACPDSPNCVSSQSQDKTHGIAPIPYTASAEEAFNQLKAVIQTLPRAEIITETTNYLYAEFTSSLMGFVDDAEFYVDPEAQVIQVRSASRIGQSDLGINRKRIETIREKLNGLNFAD
ncbi:MAG: DUF1499 domain-containing protein [Leptolyngbyaceae cyanobacterium RU_5_1]|nr:DUF1499 domain-containing protein [Leptolyngbyaceae cyanobacterium RU_5_1]